MLPLQSMLLSTVYTAEFSRYSFAFGEYIMTKSEIKPVKTAILGLGRSGWDIHVCALRKRDDFKITDVADPLPQRRTQAEEELGCSSYGSVSDLLKASSAELVVVSTQSSDHCAHTIEAFKAGKHVVVEKPIATTYADAKKMLATARKKRRKLMVHQNHRFNNDVQYFKYLCEGGSEIGKVFSIAFLDYSFARRNDWQTLKKYGGGVMNNKLTHYIDAILYATGAKVTDVLCDMQHTTDSGNCEDHVVILFKTSEGLSINISCSSSCNTDVPQWVFMGEYGTVSVFINHPEKGNSAEMRYFNPRMHKKLRVQDTKAAKGRKYGNDEKLRWYVRKNLNMKSYSIGDFYDNIFSVLRCRGKMVVTPESVIEMTRILEECRKQNPGFIF